MIELPVAPLTVFLLGVSLGLTACAATCLPFVGTLVLGRAAGRQEGLYDALAFLGGRWLSYTMLGALAGFLGAGFVQLLAGGVGNLLIGLSAVGAGLALLSPGSGHSHQQCANGRHAARRSPFLLGITLTLIPCAPLTTLLASAASTSSAAGGAVLGALFGAGALLTPMLVLIPASASVGAALGKDQPWLLGLLRWGAAAVLVAIGLRRIAAFSSVLAPWVLVGAAVFLGVQRYRMQRARRAGVRTLVFFAPRSPVPDSSTHRT